MDKINNYVGLMTIDNCQTSTNDLRLFIRHLNFQKNTMDQVLQKHLFKMRLDIKNIYAEDLKRDLSTTCVFAAKQTLSDLRTLEELLGFHQSPVLPSREAASVKDVTVAKKVDVEFSSDSVFTDSHRQLVTNEQSSEDSVTSLMDLKTGDILLLHRVSQGLNKDNVSEVMNWTDIVVVYRDSGDDLFLLTTEDNSVRLRTWRQTNNWLKRNVDRLQILRPKVSVDILASAVEKMKNHKLKHNYAFGDLIKKELKLKTSKTNIAGIGKVVLGEDLEMSPDTLILSEWKDYSAAYKTRVLSEMSEIVVPESLTISESMPKSQSLSNSRPFSKNPETFR